ncbi:WG repeat-containing protein [Sphingobacterium sp. BIGb0165]|uniref:WG repeat-containing protein n=1 Tax=Sphingobacterium sp. BIGb0165 TaxID=2940615 RepID=UPI002168BEDA|nr:WG repeat-containing protein [Sphingobacterium sp. BIGb0165]MCS4228438.1 GLPGLI family protein [Sphingobacterium sp. BIGb0165]
MKHFFLCIAFFTLVFVKISSAQQKVFKITYQFADPETGTDTSASEFIKILAGNGEALMHAYICKDQMRVESLLFGKSIQISNIKDETSYLIDENSKTYTSTDLASGKLIETSAGGDYVYSSDFEMSLIPNEKKVIAGLSCKKATFNLAGSKDKQTEITVWYAEQLPKLYWGTYDYLEKVPGAALSIGAAGLGIQATKVEEVPYDTALFEIPEGYEEGEAEETATDSALNDHLSWYQDPNTEFFGVQDSLGNKLTPAKYASIYAYVGDYAIVTDAAQMFGLIDLQGKEVIPCQYESLSLDTEGAPLVFMKDQKYGLLDNSGKLLLAAKYDFISVPSLSYALYNEGDFTGVLDLKGNVLIPAKYETIAEYRDNLALIVENLTYQLVDKSGKKLLPTGQEYLSFAGEKLLLVFKDNKYGYLDYSGKVVILFKFQNAQPFENGLALVSEDLENFYYINAKGKFIKKYEE